MYEKIRPLLISIYLHLFVFRKKKKLVLCYYGIGDTAFTLLFAKDLFEKYKRNNQKVVFVCKKSQADLFRLFKIDSVIIDNHLNRLIAIYCHRFKIQENRWVLYAGYTFSDQWKKLDGKYAINDYHDSILKIDKPISIEYPVISSEISNKINDYGVSKESVIISPYTNSSENLPLEFWDGIVEKLKKHGYSVYTNVSKSQQALKGTIRLDATLFDMFYISTLAKCFIGYRGGMCDYIALSDSHLFVVVNKMWSEKKWDVNGFSKNPTITIDYSKQDEAVIFQTLIEYINEL